MKNWMFPLLVALFIISDVAAAPAEERLPDSVQCGDELGPGGVYFLNQDLNCDVSPALTVLGETHLNLNGHTLNCGQGSMAVGIQLEGENASVMNGKVVDCYQGVIVGGSGTHHVSKIEYTNNNPSTNQAFVVESNGNRLVRNSATACNDYCFAISSDGNWLFHNVAFDADIGFWLLPYASDNRLFYNVAESQNAVGFAIQANDNIVIGNKAVGTLWESGSGFEIKGSRNRLWRNRSAENVGHGFRISNTNNLLRGNVAEDNQKSGITIRADLGSGSKDNTIVQNQAFGNGDGINFFDLNDAHLNCDDNTWKNNQFDTRNVKCIK